MSTSTITCIYAGECNIDFVVRKVLIFQSVTSSLIFFFFAQRLEVESKSITDKAKYKMISVGNGFDYIVVAQRKSLFEEFQIRFSHDYPGALFGILLSLLLTCGFLFYRLSNKNSIVLPKGKNDSKKIASGIQDKKKQK